MILSRLDPRSATVVRLTILGLFSWTVVGARPAPAGAGRGLVIAVALGISMVGWLVWTVRALRGDLSGATPELYAMAAAGGVLTAASPSSAASAFVFVAVIAAGLRAEVRGALPVVVVGAFSLALAMLLYDESALGCLAYTLGFLAALLAASTSRGAALRTEQAELLLAQTQRSHEEQLRAARLEESTRIARDIHDVLAHTLAGLAIQLEATGSLIEQGADRETLLARVSRAHELAREGLTETRRAVGALRGEHDVAGAIEKLVAEHGAALHLEGQPARLTGPVGEAVIRVAQESLTNVRKHAPGASVSVLLDAGDEVRLVVEDRFADGRAAVSGPLATSGGGFGIRGMRERAAELGGTLSAGAVAGGWRVELRLPIGSRP